MTTVLAHPQPTIPNPRTSVTPIRLTFFDSSILEISPIVPFSAAGRRAHAMSGQIYFFGGRIDRADGYLGGYLGQSGDLNGPRAATSFTRWIVSQRRILPAASALLRRDTPYDDDYRLYVEARAIMNISAAGIWLLNTHTSAGTASSRLTRTQITEGQHLATNISDAILRYVFAGRANPHPSPAANTRESAVREVLHAPRGIDTFEVLRALRAAGITSKGRTFDFTIRRDLNIREKDTRGTPRVVSTWHRGRRVFWNPLTLAKNEALRGYDLAHPGLTPK
ncbi:MAG: hypothetical protein ACOH2F_03710 [Cellulomonas sp.]